MTTSHSDFRGRPVVLIDGRVVDSWSEEWRAECEARAVIALPTLSRRREYLFGKIDQWGKPRNGILQRRGEAACIALSDLISAVWKHTRENP